MSSAPSTLKYVLLDDDIVYPSQIEECGADEDLFLRRVKYLIDIPSKGIKAGDLGGWIRNESNLSQEGTCAVLGEAWVYDDAQVSEDAKVTGKARVYWDARVFGKAIICGDAQVMDRAQVFGTSMVSEDACIFGESKVHDFSVVIGDVTVDGEAEICGDAHLMGRVSINGKALIKSNKDFKCVSPVGNDPYSSFTGFRSSDGTLLFNIGAVTETLTRCMEMIPPSGPYYKDKYRALRFIESCLSAQ